MPICPIVRCSKNTNCPCNCSLTVFGAPGRVCILRTTGFRRSGLLFWGKTGFRSNGSFSGLLGFWNNGSLEQWADTKCTVSGNEFGKSIIFTNPTRSRTEELTLAYSLLASYTMDELCFTFLGFSKCLQQETTQSISTNLYPSQRVYIQWPMQT